MGDTRFRHRPDPIDTDFDGRPAEDDAVGTFDPGLHPEPSGITPQGAWVWSFGAAS